MNAIAGAPRHAAPRTPLRRPPVPSAVSAGRHARAETSSQRATHPRWSRRWALAVPGFVLLVGASFVAGFTTQPSDGADADQVWQPPDVAPQPAGGTNLPGGPAAVLVPTSPSPDRRLEPDQTIGGDIRPKSVAASPAGTVLAQNMMYRHSITVYGADGSLAATIPDQVDLAGFGVDGHPGVSSGAPVEADFSPDGRTAYVSNYSMYGTGFGAEGTDDCSPEQHVDPSYVYRIDMAGPAVAGVIAVGSVPKYVRVTPDGRYLLVSNWCSSDLSVVDLASQQEVKRIPLDRYPRGIAVDPGSRTAYVAMMGDDRIAQVDLGSFEVSWIDDVGSGPRHLVIDPGGAWLYATLNGDGRVVKIDLATHAVVAEASTGDAPRSMAIAPDGLSLYVVNYESDTLTKLRTDDLSELQTVKTGDEPIGVAFEPTRSRVWVAVYTGEIEVFSDT